MKPRWLLLGALAAIAAAPAFGGDPACKTAPNVEQLRYSWRLRGGIRFLAGLVFPTSGVGNLRTTYPTASDASIYSELLITAPGGKKGGYYTYESQMDASGAKTLMTFHGYEWGKKARSERTLFDYAKGLARIRKETTEEVQNRVKKLPEREEPFRDILTAIQYLRQNAHTLLKPVETTIYSDGKEYPVLIRPGGRRTFVISGQAVAASGVEVVDAPGGKKWPGGVKVWFSDDERRIPCRIEIRQSVASLQLDLQSVDACELASAP
jgi:Protein of unknown function (DUF3108)